MPEDDSGRIILDPAKGNKSLAFEPGSSSVNGEALRVAINRRFPILAEDTLVTPVTEKASRAGIHVVIGEIGGAFPQNDAYHVVGSSRVIAILYLWSDLVVWLRNCIRNIDPRRVIAKRAKG